MNQPPVAPYMGAYSLGTLTKLQTHPIISHKFQDRLRDDAGAFKEGKLEESPAGFKAKHIGCTVCTALA